MVQFGEERTEILDRNMFFNCFSRYVEFKHVIRDCSDTLNHTT